MAGRLKVASIRQLSDLAKQAPPGISAKAFVDLVFEREKHPKRSRNAPLVDGEIRHWQARMFASEWDREGITPVSEFVEALSCEARGHPRAEARSEILSERFSRVPEDRDDEDEPDEYARWRYAA